MKTQITIRCPSCLGLSIKKNGWKIYGKQNYQCKDCHRQFIHETELSYQGCKIDIDDKIRLMLVRGCSVADIVVSEIVAFVWGKRNLKTARELRAKLDALGIDFGYICCDNWDSFLTAFDFDFKQVGKRHTVDIEGNNNRSWQRVRRVFRKTCCFSKKLENHFKAFDLLFHYVNYGWV